MAPRPGRGNLKTNGGGGPGDQCAREEIINDDYPSTITFLGGKKKKKKAKKKTYKQRGGAVVKGRPHIELGVSLQKKHKGAGKREVWYSRNKRQHTNGGENRKERE